MQQSIVPWIGVALGTAIASCNADAHDDVEADVSPSTSVDAATPMAPADAGAEASEGISFGGGRGPNFKAVDRDYNAILDASVDVAEFFCECEVADTTGEDFEGCVGSYVTPPPPPLLYCSKEVYSQSEGAAAAIACQRTLVDAYVDCLMQSDCFDFDHIFECELDRILQDLECEDIPYVDWAREQENCFGRQMDEPFECLNGELIDPSWVCDLAEDCTDGSDEAGCNPHAGVAGAEGL